MISFFSESIMCQLEQELSFNSQLSEIGVQNDVKVFEDPFEKTFPNIFVPNIIINEEIDESSRYLIGNSNKLISKGKSPSQNSTNQSDSIKIETKIDSIKIKKRGRPKGQNNSLIKANQNDHNKYSMDNILRKVQVHFFNFIISILNDILKELNFTERFLKISYDAKNDVCKDKVESLKTKEISDIVCLDISSKYNTKDKNTNRNIYDKIKDNEILNKLFKAKYMEFFDIYYKNKSKYINFTKFGLEKEVRRSDKTKVFFDLSKKNEHDKEYIRNLNYAISQYYFNNKFVKY